MTITWSDPINFAYLSQAKAIHGTIFAMYRMFQIRG